MYANDTSGQSTQGPALGLSAPTFPDRAVQGCYARGSETVRAAQLQRREFIALVGGAAAVWPLAARAQVTAKTYRIFWVSTESQPDPFLDGFREGLRERGYIEGKNFTLELRYAPGNPDALNAVISELKDGNVDLAVSSGPA